MDGLQVLEGLQERIASALQPNSVQQSAPMLTVILCAVTSEILPACVQPLPPAEAAVLQTFAQGLLSGAAALAMVGACLRSSLLNDIEICMKNCADCQKAVTVLEVAKCLREHEYGGSQLHCYFKASFKASMRSLVRSSCNGFLIQIQGLK